MEKEQYEENQHLHLGYYEKGYDLEAIALKVLGKSKWVVFFPFDSYKITIPPDYKRAHMEPGFGQLIFTQENDKELQDKFHQWVERILLPYIKH